METSAGPRSVDGDSPAPLLLLVDAAGNGDDGTARIATQMMVLLQHCSCNTAAPALSRSAQIGLCSGTWMPYPAALLVP